MRPPVDLHAEIQRLEDALTRRQDIAIQTLRTELFALVSAKIEGEGRMLQLNIATLLDAKIADAIASLPPPKDHSALAAAVLEDTNRSEFALALINDLAQKITDYINADRYTITRRQVTSILKDINANG